MIPKKLHFIWIGNNKIPEYSVQFIESWKQLYPDYELIIWTDNLITQYNIIPDTLRDAYNDDKFAPAFKADILRYLLINRFGGLYFDTDFEPLKRMPDEFLSFDFLGGVQNNGEVAIGFFGSEIGSIVLEDTIQSLIVSIKTSQRNGIL